MPVYTITLTSKTGQPQDPSEAGRIFAEFIAGKIPIAATIEPRPDLALGHTFTWPSNEIEKSRKSPTSYKPVDKT